MLYRNTVSPLMFRMETKCITILAIICRCHKYHLQVGVRFHFSQICHLANLPVKKIAPLGCHSGLDECPIQSATQQGKHHQAVHCLVRLESNMQYTHRGVEPMDGIPYSVESTCIWFMTWVNRCIANLLIVCRCQQSQ
jgi:hypothetical protein